MGKLDRPAMVKKTSAAARKARSQSGMSQSQAAASLGVTKTTISRIENGHQLPDLATLIGMCDLYGVSLENFRK